MMYTMRFLYVLLAATADLAQDGATRADWPHHGGTQMSWRYSALDLEGRQLEIRWRRSLDDRLLRSGVECGLLGTGNAAGDFYAEDRYAGGPERELWRSALTATLNWNRF